MKRYFTFVLVGIWTFAVAQAPPGEELAEGAESGEQGKKCVPAADLPKASDGDAGQLERDQENVVRGPVPCEELLVVEEAGETDKDPEGAVEENAGIEASAKEEFEPGDEISEDFPVPLPADI